MGIRIVINQLKSRVIRLAAVNGRAADPFNPNLSTSRPRGKTRKIDKFGSLRSNEGSGGIINRIIDFSGRLLGFIDKALGVLSISFTRLFSWLISTVQRISYFNWNTTDAQIDESIKNYNLQLVQIWAGLAGEGFGWLAGAAFGGAVAMIVPVIGGSLLARSVFTKTLLEGGDELLGSLRAAITQTIGLLANQGLLLGYKNIRGLLKRLPQSVLNTLFGSERAKWIKYHWGNEGEPVITFQEKYEERLDRIENDFLREGIEEFLEEAWESFIEAGFVAMIEIDSAYQQYRQAQEAQEGEEKRVRIYPDRDAQEHYYTLPPLPQQRAIQSSLQVINQHRELGDRDLGTFVGQQVRELARSEPMLRQLTIEFSTRKEPPWTDPETGKREIFVISLPNLKLGVRWRDLKRTTRNWKHGPVRLNARLNSRRKITFYCENATQGEIRLKELIDLCDDEISNIWEGKARDTDRVTRIPIRDVYPKSAKLLFRQNARLPDGTWQLNSRQATKEYIEIPLWTNEQPDWILDPIEANRVTAIT